MENISIQDILALVNQPSRYLGSEVNRIVKDHRKVRLRIALAFPDLYEVGTSHFGMQILYHILNSRKEIAAERVFAPDLDMAATLRRHQMPLTSLESHTPLKDFDILGFSLLYELNYTNMLEMLDLAGIDFLARDREQDLPLIIGGGPCTCNPEPVADFFDALVIGDGEEVVLEMAQAWLEWKAGGEDGKEVLLQRWSKIEGVYIPSFFEAAYDSKGLQTIKPLQAGYRRVRRAVVADLNRCAFPDAPVVPYGRPIHDRLRLEIARGCTRGCRFCQAGMIYRPVRERAWRRLIALAKASIDNTGYEDLSMLSLSTGDFSAIGRLTEELMGFCQQRRIAVSLPSLRAGTLDPGIIEQIRRVRKTGFTLAPEAGSQRLRDAINKNITEEEIISSIQEAFRAGWRSIKLYFMVGLPMEKELDVDEIFRLVMRARRHCLGKKCGGQLHVSVGTFVPKAHTPFQWCRQVSTESARERIEGLRIKFRVPGIRFKWQNPEVSAIEGLWARGDRRLRDVLIRAHRQGCRFDGWSDRFDYRSWLSVLLQCGIDIEGNLGREKDVDEPLPWDHIDNRVAKSFLADELKKARALESTGDCRDGICQGCGVCDFESIAPKVGHEDPCLPDSGEPGGKYPAGKVFCKYRIGFSKRDGARFFAHLELANIMSRAVRRAKLPVRYTEGFNPKIKMSFEDPLPVGMESEAEYFYIWVDADFGSKEISSSINRRLPEGLDITSCEACDAKKVPQRPVHSFEIRLGEGSFEAHKLKEFSEKEIFVSEKSDGRGIVRRIDLKSVVKGMTRIDARNLRMEICAGEKRGVRPAEVLRAVFGLSESAIKKARVIKKKDQPGKSR